MQVLCHDASWSSRASAFRSAWPGNFIRMLLCLATGAIGLVAYGPSRTTRALADSLTATVCCNPDPAVY